MAAEVDFRNSEESRLLSKLTFIKCIIYDIENTISLYKDISKDINRASRLSALKRIYNDSFTRLEGKINITKVQFSQIYLSHRISQLQIIKDECEQINPGMRLFIESLRENIYNNEMILMYYDHIIEEMRSYEQGSAVLKMKYLKYKLKYLALKNRN
jgi:hypothetical protein